MKICLRPVDDVKCVFFLIQKKNNNNIIYFLYLVIRSLSAGPEKN